MGFGPEDPGVRRAAEVSGICELLVALGLFSAHFYFFMTEHLQELVDRGALGNERVQFGLGMAVYLEFLLLSPLTWVLAYLMGEGVVRFMAALITGEVLPTLPTKLIELGMLRLKRFAVESKLPPVVEDEVLSLGPIGYRVLSCREKDWDLATTVRIGIRMFGVHTIENVGGARPHCYDLRPLPQGRLIRKLRTLSVPAGGIRTEAQSQDSSTKAAIGVPPPRARV